MITVEAIHTVTGISAGGIKFIILAGTHGRIVTDGYSAGQDKDVRVQWFEAIVSNPETNSNPLTTRQEARDIIMSCPACYLRIVSSSHDTRTGDAQPANNNCVGVDPPNPLPEKPKNKRR